MMNDFKWPLMKDAITEQDKAALIEFIQNTNKFTNGPMVRKFEQEWSEWLGADQSLMVSSGSTANFLLIAAVKELYGLKDGDKVLVPACTWMTNVAPVMQLGFQPVFCDIEMKTYGFDIEYLKSIPNPKDIKIVFVSHLLGLRCPIEQYKEIFPNAIFIEDICESHGITNDYGVKQGSESLGATFSFYFGHHMTSIEGGIVSTNNEELYDLMRMKRSHGLARESKHYEFYKLYHPEIQPEFLFMTDGYNFRSSDLNAVLASSQLKNLSKSIEVRKQNFEYFMSFMPADKFYLPSRSENNSSFCFPVVSKTKRQHNKLMAKLKEAKIEFRPVIGGNLLKHPFLTNKGYELNTEISNVDIVHNQGLYLGNNHMIGTEEIDILRDIIEGI